MDAGSDPRNPLHHDDWCYSPQVLYRFLWIGATRNPTFAAAEEDYLRRIGRYADCEVATVPERRKTDPRAVQAQQSREEADVLKRLRPGAKLVVLDENGRQFSSVEFAELLQVELEAGTREMTILAGGFQGVPEGLLQRAELRLSLGRMTYPHELARVMVLEQVYRALTILRGIPYHR